MSRTPPRKLMGKKRGMTQLFDDQGHAIPCTVIEAEPNVIAQIKTVETDGYNAIQIAFDKIQLKDPRTIDARSTKPLQGHYKKAGIEPRRHLTELRLDTVDGFEVGQELNATIFNDIAYVDVTAISKGKGYQGVIKLHNYAGGPAAHGSSFHRHAGSTGMRTSPGRCLPGGKRASHMGLNRQTVQNLRVIKVLDNCIVVEGQVPGPRNGLVFVTNAVKKQITKKKHH